MRISDWSSDVCSSDLAVGRAGVVVLAHRAHFLPDRLPQPAGGDAQLDVGLLELPARGADHPGPGLGRKANGPVSRRSEEHTSELQSLMRIPYAVFCLTQKKHAPHVAHSGTFTSKAHT